VTGIVEVERRGRPVRHRRSSPGGPIFAFVGGVLAVVGSTLTWASVGAGGREFDTGGLGLTDGWITLGLGGLVAVAAVAMLTVRRRGAWRALGLLAAGGAIVAGSISVNDAVTASDSVGEAVAEEVARASGLPVEEARDQVDRDMDAGLLTVSVEAGLSVVLAGAALALLGGIASAASGQGRRVSLPPRPAPLRGVTQDLPSPYPPYPWERTSPDDRALP
jgi:hypothetical protein